MPSRKALVATADDLPAAVADALRAPPPAEQGRATVDGRHWRFLTWGRPDAPALLLVHGVGSSAAGWWRVGPALAAAGRRVVAIDMPGHGPEARWDGRHRFADTAEELSAFVRGADLASPDLAVVGHSWGAVVAAHLPQVGIRPAALVLIDPPWLSLEQLKGMAADPSERRYESFEEARTAVRANNPGWSEGDVEAKAHAVTEYDEACVRAVLLENGAYDAGMSALRDPTARGVRVSLIHGEWSAGGLIPDAALASLRAQIGADRVMGIAQGPHSPHRTHPEATVLAILRAID